MKMETMMEEGEEEYLNQEESWNYELDVSQLCRICANPNEYLIPIFHGEGLEHELKSKISKHLPIKILEDDKLPTQLCYQCASTLIAWHDMVVGCLEADEKLRALFPDDKIEIDIPEVIGHNNMEECTVEVENNKMKSTPVQHMIKITTESDVENVVQELQISPTIDTEKVALEEEVTSVEPELIEEVSPDTRYEEMEEDLNDDNNYSQVNGKRGIEFEDDFLSDFESDEEEFSTLYTCNICKASDMAIGEFLIHTKEHTKEEKQKALEKLVDFKETEEVAARNAAAAYGFKVQPSLESSVTLYVCTVCGQGNLMLKNLKEHSVLHPEITESHFCNLCQKQFNDIDELNTHLEIHLDNNDLVCQYCNMRFSIIDDLEFHENTHSKAEYVCVDCRKSFRSKEFVLLHLKENHSTDTTCHICDMDFQTDKLLFKHFMTHAAVHLVKKMINSFACDFCAKRYDSKISLQRHIIFLHNDRMPFICKHCGFTAYHEEPLKEHLSRKHSNQDKSMCYKCGLLFDKKSHLEKHMRNHTEKQTYTCKFCGVQVKHLLNLRYHMTSHGDVKCLKLKTDDLINYNTEERKPCPKRKRANKNSSFVCFHCGKLFDVEESYVEHLKSHPPSMMCNFCGKHFKGEMPLNVHLNKAHTSKFCRPDLKNCGFPFKCNKCNATFRLEFELEIHAKIHEVSSQQCHLCFEEFKSDRKLQEHLKIHDEDTYECVETTESTNSDEPAT